MKKRVAKILRQNKKKIQERLERTNNPTHDGPVLKTPNIHYDVSQRDRGINYGGIGAIQSMVKHLHLEDLINQLSVFKIHNPYYESDHVLNIAYNILCQGECLEDIERLRMDDAYLDLLGATRIPDPTTAGDFCRRFSILQVDLLQQYINEARLKVWRQQDAAFFEQAIIDSDGTLTPTSGECKEGMDLSYQGSWGYHPLVVSLANTQEPLYLVNRSGNQTSSSGAAAYIDRAIALCQQAGFRTIRLRGDTDFSQTAYLDGWNVQDNVVFNFGIDAMPNLVALAEALPESGWEAMSRPPKYTVKTTPREKPPNVKEAVVKRRELKNLRLQSEHVAEFAYRPGKCCQPYRLVVLRKNISVERGEKVLFDEVRYFFYITNDWKSSAREIVLDANQRCHQENLIEQLKNGVRSLRMPVDTLVSNWAYMVMASLAWSLKAWYGLLLPTGGRWGPRREQERSDVLRMEFKKFRRYLICLPCQIIQRGRRLICRLLGWNPYVAVVVRAWETFRQPLRC